MKVLLGPSSFGVSDDAPLVRLRQCGFDIINNPYKRKLTKFELLALLTDKIDGLIAGLEPLDRSVLENSSLKVISRCGAGVSNIDLEAARERGIIVRNTPDAPTNAVAELTLGAILTVLRQLPWMDQQLHQGSWSRRIGYELSGKTVLVIGFGRIGRRLAEMLVPFEVNLLVTDPALVSGQLERGEVLALDKALPRADIICLHSSGEQCVLGERQFNKMKPGVYVFNAARGGVVDEAALIKAIEQNIVAGGWIDTFADEPYQGALVAFPQLLLTPHVGSYTKECRLDMEMQAVDNLVEAFKAIKSA